MAQVRKRTDSTVLPQSVQKVFGCCFKLTSRPGRAYLARPVGRAAAARLRVEESPGSMEKRWRLTAAGGDPRESATENRPPGRAPARVKRCGKSAPRCRQRQWQGKPRREQDRIGAARDGQPSQGSPPRLPGLVARDPSRGGSQRNGRHVGAFGRRPYRTRLTGRLDLRFLPCADDQPAGMPAIPRADFTSRQA